MLQWSSVLLKELYNLDLAPKENWPKRGRARNLGAYQSSFRYENLF